MKNRKEHQYRIGREIKLAKKWQNGRTLGVGVSFTGKKRYKDGYCSLYTIAYERYYNKNAAIVNVCYQ